MLRQILEKTQEKQIDKHHLFVDFKAAFDTSHRLCEMTLRSAQCVVKVGNNISEPYDAKLGLRQDDPYIATSLRYLWRRTSARLA